MAYEDGNTEVGAQKVDSSPDKAAVATKLFQTIGLHGGPSVLAGSVIPENFLRTLHESGMLPEDS